MSLQVLLELRDVSYEIGAVTGSKIDGTLGDARASLVVFACLTIATSKPASALYRSRTATAAAGGTRPTGSRSGE